MLSTWGSHGPGGGDGRIVRQLAVSQAHPAPLISILTIIWALKSGPLCM